MLKLINGTPIQVRPQYIQEGNVVVAYLKKDNYVNVVSQSIENARKTVFITMFGVSPGTINQNEKSTSIIGQIIRAAIRGVNCRIVLSATGPHARINAFNYKAAEKMREAGVKVKFMGGHELLHQKQIIIDGSITIVGSHNISARAITKNRDISIMIQSLDIASFAMDEFNYCWKMGR